MLRLPDGRAPSLALGGPAANSYFAKLDREVRHAARERDFVVGSDGHDVGLVPASRARARRAADGGAAARRRRAQASRVAPIVVGTVEARAHDGGTRGDGDHRHRRLLRDVLRRHREPHPQRPARRASRRRQADRSRRDVLVQRHDRRAHGGEGLPRGAGDHQRRALRPGSAAASARSRRPSSTPRTRRVCRSPRVRTTRSTSRTTRWARRDRGTTRTST